MFTCFLIPLKTEETQRTVRGLEDVHGRLEEEHGLQVSLLLAAQEKAQQRLHAVRTQSCTIIIILLHYNCSLLFYN